MTFVTYKKDFMAFTKKSLTYILHEIFNLLIFLGQFLTFLAFIK